MSPLCLHHLGRIELPTHSNVGRVPVGVDPCIASLRGRDALGGLAQRLVVVLGGIDRSYVDGAGEVACRPIPSRQENRADPEVGQGIHVIGGLLRESR